MLWYQHHDWTETSQRFRNQELLKMHVYFFLLLVMYTLSSVHAYPDGSVASVCDSMIPNHSSYMSQSTTAPYRVTVDRMTCMQGDMIRVILESVNNTDFEGFMVQARPTSGNKAVGSFMPGNASLVRLHNCFNSQKSCISHSAANELTRIEVMWMAPSIPASYNITFCATFVKNYAEFWPMVRSQTVLLSQSPSSAVNSLMMPLCVPIALGLFHSGLSLYSGNGYNW